MFCVDVLLLCIKCRLETSIPSSPPPKSSTQNSHVTFGIRSLGNLFCNKEVYKVGHACIRGVGSQKMGGALNIECRD